MPYPVVADDVFRVTAVCSQASQWSYNSKLLKIQSLSPAATVYQGELASDISTALAAIYVPLLSNVARYEGVLIRRVVGAAPNPRASFSTVGNAVGQVLGNLLAKQTAGLLSLYTPVAGRRGRGRIYVPFPGGSDNDAAGSPTGPYVNGLTGLGDYWATSHTTPGTIGTATWQAGLEQMLPDPFTYFDAYTARDAWATQRRRGDFGQVNRNPFI